jgi:hypothetical protein
VLLAEHAAKRARKVEDVVESLERKASRLWKEEVDDGDE